MGGSSLCPEVLRMTFGKIDGFPELHVLDSTDPAQIKAIESKDRSLQDHLFIVSSKSGSTLEPNIFKQYFFERVKKKWATTKSAIASSPSPIPAPRCSRSPRRDNFRHIFYGVPSIGGRYSALSDFGMVPAAVMGIDVSEIPRPTPQEMVKACGAASPSTTIPACCWARSWAWPRNHGRDKITIIASPGNFRSRRVARAIDRRIHRQDRQRHHPCRSRTARQARQSMATIASSPICASKPRPTKRRTPPSTRSKRPAIPSCASPSTNIYNLGQEFFRWEIATAVAGSIIGINAFNQPDVEASKIETKKLTSEYEKTGTLPDESPILRRRRHQALHRRKKHRRALKGRPSPRAKFLKAHLGRLHAGDYFALLGYITMNDAQRESAPNHSAMPSATKSKSPPCLGFGPRFLHSTGQAYKGGPNSGVFLQITCDDAVDLPVPDQKYTFGVVKAAQARGDFAGPCRTRPPRAARASRQRCSRRPGHLDQSRETGHRINCLSSSLQKISGHHRGGCKMQLGMIGLGRMGANMVRRLHTRRPSVRRVSTAARRFRQAACPAKARPAAILSTSSSKNSQKPRAVWLMVPAGVVDATLHDLARQARKRRHPHRWRQLLLHRRHSPRQGIIRQGHCTTWMSAPAAASGDSSAATAMMIGGENDIVKHLDPIFKTLAPGRGNIDRTPGREKAGGTAEEGYLHCGPSGAGHFVKMVHNGIEYGLMAAYAEGLNILKHANAGKSHRETDAETAPLRNADHYQYDFNLADVTEVWRRGSVVASWLLDLTAISLFGSAQLLSVFPAASPIPAKAAGPSSRPSSPPLRPRCSAPLFISVSHRRGKTISPEKFCPRCASSSVDTSRKNPGH